MRRLVTSVLVTTVWFLPLFLQTNPEYNLIVSGALMPSPREYDEMLEKKGVKTSLKILHEFLRENPDHLDAKADLLKEVRRHALMCLPANVSEDLDAKTDLMVWGVLAKETDNIFRGYWMGIDLDFFRPDQDQPERFSKLMRTVFRKHIASLESAIKEQLSDSTLWNIWAWMARSLGGDYKWGNFINTLEPFNFSLDPIVTSPSPDVCVWLIEDSRQIKDWETILKFAKFARSSYRTYRPTERIEWIPGFQPSPYTYRYMEIIEDYPVKSVYAPHLEALLRLGRLEEANRVYDEMIRLEEALTRHETNTNNAHIAANVARAAGMKELAEIWELGEQINQEPYIIRYGFDWRPFILYSYAKRNTGFFENTDLIDQLSPSLPTISGRDLNIDTLGWKKGDGDRWALFGRDLHVLEQGFGPLDYNILQTALNRHNIKSDLDLARDYITEHGANPGLELHLAFTIIRRNFIALWQQINQAATPINFDWYNNSCTEACNYLKQLLSNHPDILINSPLVLDDIIIPYPLVLTNNAIQSTSLKSISKPILEILERLLIKKPSSYSLWDQWFFWKTLENAGRPIEHLIKSIKTSPLTRPGTVPPSRVFETYYKECKENEDWHKVIALLRNIWDREYARLIGLQKSNPGVKLIKTETSYAFYFRKDWEAHYMISTAPYLGDELAIPLIEAYLMDDKPSEAKEIFNAWLDCGGTFTDVALIIELAKKKGHESLARDWELKTMVNIPSLLY